MQALLMFILPLIGLLAVRFANSRVNASRLALAFSLLPLADTIYKLTMFDPQGGTQFSCFYYWIEGLGIGFNVGVDGLSMLMILLTNALVPLILFSSFNREIKDYINFYSLIFLMQFALIGVFTALDGFLFYVFWELALIPIWFICLLWGGKDRIRITLKFFIYTLSGSLLMLVGLVYLYLQTPGTHSFDLESLYALQLNDTEQGVIFWAFFLAFAIKIPVFPFHTWQPDTYTNAPTQGTMLLSGIMLKMGLYGIIRFMIPIIPQGVEDYSWIAIGMAVVGILYASSMAIAQKDFKRLIAYSSIAHVGLITAGILSLDLMALQGGVFQMLSHGVNAVGLFFIADILQHRYNNHTMDEMGGIAHKSSPFAIGFMIILLASIALPLTNGFIGEFMLLAGLYNYGVYVTMFAGLTVILGAVYMLRAYQKIMLGDINASAEAFIPLHLNEKIMIGIICTLIIVMGVYPKPLLEIAEPSLKIILESAAIK